MLLVDAHNLLQLAVRPHVNRTAVLLSLALTPLFRLHSDHHFGQLYHVALCDAVAALSLSKSIAFQSCMTDAHTACIPSQYRFNILAVCSCQWLCSRERGKLDVGSGPWSLQLLAQTIRQVLHPMIPLDIQQQPTR